jgi:hypothetical protein
MILVDRFNAGIRMPKFFEIYGDRPYSDSEDFVSRRVQAHCPFTDALCDGGGNRHQTRIRLNDDHQLRQYFQPGIETVVPAVCAIGPSADQSWIVCPRRIFGFSLPINEELVVNDGLCEHEKKMLLASGAPVGVELGVWPEVYLEFQGDGVEIDYHFDFIIAEIQRNVSIKEQCSNVGIFGKSELLDAINSARRGRYLKGRANPDTRLNLLPNLNSPIIVEVMTASTSGSNREKGTDIASAFTNVIQSFQHDGPGINKRQVWGRMATQLFAKTALAEKWGGKTIWVVQDQLIKNIEMTTGMSLQNSSAAQKGEFINFAILGYKNDLGNDVAPVVEFKGMRTGKSGLSAGGTGTCVDILLPKILPPMATLMNAVLRRRPVALIRL